MEPNRNSGGSLSERRVRSFGKGAELFYARPLEFVRGEGAALFDPNGRRYLDLYNNVPAVGHGNAHVADAVCRQQRLLNVHSRYLGAGIVDYAERLLALHHDGIDNIVFSCSGTEANEVAIQMARLATGQRGIVCSDAAYHGNSDLVNRLTTVGRAPERYSDVRAFPFPDSYRPIRPGLSGEALAEAYLERIADAIRALQASGEGFAAMLVCPIFANEGLPDMPPAFMERAAALVHAAGGVMIADEVQSGFGRTGHWWGYQATGFRPDIVTMGKPMGNGVPLSATAASREIVERFRICIDHFNTTASTPLQAAAGMAVLDEIERMDLVAHAGAQGALLAGELRRICADVPFVGDVRAKGLFLVVDIVTDRASRGPDAARAATIVEQLKDMGFLMAAAGAHRNLVKIRPPLVVKRADLETFLVAFDRIMQAEQCP